MSSLEWEAVGAGLRAGLPWFVPTLGLQFVLLAAFDDPSGLWFIAFLVFFTVAFVRGGQAATAAATDRRLAHAALTGVLLVVVWIPLRALVAVMGDSDRPFSGTPAALAIGALGGMVGGVLVLRKEARR